MGGASAPLKQPPERRLECGKLWLHFSLDQSGAFVKYDGTRCLVSKLYDQIF